MLSHGVACGSLRDWDLHPFCFLGVSKTRMTSDISAFLFVPKVGANVGDMVDGMMGGMVDGLMSSGIMGNGMISGTVGGMVSDKVGGAVAEENDSVGNDVINVGVLHQLSNL